MRRLRKNKKGFTLVELIVVIVILGILLAVLVPGVVGWIDKARDSQIKANARTAYLAAETALVEAYSSGNTSPPTGAGELNQLILDAGLEDTYASTGSIEYVVLGTGDGIDRFSIKRLHFKAQSKWAILEDGKWTVTNENPSAG